MRTVRFLRDTDARREGGPGYKAGDTVTLQDDSAKRWIARSAAVPVQSEPAAPAVADQGTKAPEQPVVTGDELDQLLGTGNVKPVEGASDVAGQDGGDPGDGAESDEGASSVRPRGRGARSRGQ